MISFQLRKNLLVATFIIAVIAMLWLLISAILTMFTADKENHDNSKVITDYIEKIDNFALQEFNEKQQLTRFVEAKNYFNFKDKPALLFNPIVTFYKEAGKEDYTLTAKYAYYLKNGKIKFEDEVNINSNSGVIHKMNAEELLVSTKTNDLVSHKAIVYLDANAEVIAQGMTMQSKGDKMKLIGKIRVNQGSGQILLTRDLLIDQSNSQKHYYSKNDTIYLAFNSKIYAQGFDMNIHKKMIILLGKVKILQESGAKIDTKALIVDQSKGGEIYQTKEKVHYQFGISDIRAMGGMYYNVQDQKIKLTGGVTARYE